MGHAYHLTGRYEEAIAVSKRALARNPNLFDAHMLLALSYGELGREEDARAAVAELLKIAALCRLWMVWKLKFPYKDPAIVERQLDLLRKAGLKWRWPTENPEALGSLLGRAGTFSRRTKEGNAQARQRFERAIALDPQYAAAYAFLGLTYSHGVGLGTGVRTPRSLERAFALAKRPWL